MTAFTFMQNAFYVLVGVVCVSAAAVIVCAVIIGFIRVAKGDRKRGK